MVLGANSSRPTGSLRQRPKPQKLPRAGIADTSSQRKQAKVLTDADHYLTLRESCVASLRSDRHEIGMTDRHHWNPQDISVRGVGSQDSDTVGTAPPEIPEHLKTVEGSHFTRLGMAGTIGSTWIIRSPESCSPFDPGIQPIAQPQGTIRRSDRDVKIAAEEDFGLPVVAPYGIAQTQSGLVIHIAPPESIVTY